MTSYNMEEYAKNLYEAKNILGYTGDINNNPTVYFKKGDEYGHITQGHKNNDNNGREIGMSSPFYVLSNSGPNKCLQESIDGQVHHTSHSPLIYIYLLKKSVMYLQIQLIDLKN